ncbi:glycosyltransferase family 4 protein [Natrarchaeobius sp. A-rgal3]|uniref:glycosyltransferase family 4 protein n=1 Tax=Natrarchaeobius versutus TaxID=1679078 RepID=UPI00350EC067
MRQGQTDWESIAEFYGLETKFEVQTVPTLQSRFQTVPQIGLLSMAGTMCSWLVTRVLTGQIDSSDIIYGRNYYGMFLFNEIRKAVPANRRPKLVFEMHTPISAHLKPRFFQAVDKLVCITDKLKRYVLDQYPIDRSSVLVAPDGVDLRPYRSRTRAEARSELTIPENERIVAYTGHLYPGKGVEVLIESAKEIDATVYVVGGYEDDINRVKRSTNYSENVVFTGFVDPADIPVYQIAADVLVAPYTESSRPWVSPLKLFEYMAAGRPIIASDREVLKEVLVDGENALLFEKGNAESLRNQIERVLESNALATNLGTKARQESKRYTWKKRAERIVSAIYECK